jgi:hypothetical protein
MEPHSTVIWRRPAAAFALALLALAPLTSCRSGRTQAGVTFSSDPPGARVLVNGADSGFVTPTALSLPRGDWHRIELRREGYQPVTRLVSPQIRVVAIPWTDGYLGPGTWWFPLFLSFKDFALPVLVDDNSSPQRIHARLRLSPAS